MTPSPFPGMDPYLEEPTRWPGVHARLITIIADTLAPLVVPQFTVAIEERIYIASPDGLIVESIGMEEIRERYLEVRDTRTRAVITTIEVVSPGATNRTRDYRHKRTEYAARGISEYWIVDPEERQITVCKWVDGQYEDTVFKASDRIESDVVPSLELTVERVFTVEP